MLDEWCSYHINSTGWCYSDILELDTRLFLELGPKKLIVSLSGTACVIFNLLRGHQHFCCLSRKVHRWLWSKRATYIKEIRDLNSTFNVCIHFDVFVCPWAHNSQILCLFEIMWKLFRSQVKSANVVID